MINRTRRQDIQNDFCVRRPQSISVHFTLEQQELYDALMEFEAHALSYLHNNVPLEFMMSTLMRQASSLHLWSGTAAEGYGVPATGRYSFRLLR